ncbi:MAG: HypC/HybG/HupF family hydrogenase formation chaperone [Deltaproteobacteria bacterium]|nr:HypC/HybG/HupF family hydrogenase formation chaperone [Deltaproteobacteria bacterium]
MCLAVPMEITSLDGDIATVEVGGVTNQVRLDIVDRRPELGDYVIVHAGFALRCMDRAEGRETLRLFEEGLQLELL